MRLATGSQLVMSIDFCPQRSMGLFLVQVIIVGKHTFSLKLQCFTWRRKSLNLNAPDLHFSSRWSTSFLLL